MIHQALYLPIREFIQELERDYFDVLLTNYAGRVTEVAKHAGLDRTSMYRKFERLGIDPSSYRKRAA